MNYNVNDKQHQCANNILYRIFQLTHLMSSLHYPKNMKQLNDQIILQQREKWVLLK